MRTTRHLLALLLACGAFLPACSSGPAAQPAEGKVFPWEVLPADAGDRMFDLAKELAEGCSPRDAGTAGATRASRWIAQKLLALGLYPEVDCWIEDTAHGKKAFCNVYADFPGISGRTVVVCSHYDTKSGIPGFQGANDGAATTAVLLGLAEHFVRRGVHLTDTIRFAFLDGEECFGKTYRADDGLHGSNRLAAFYKAEPQDPPPVLAAIVIDMTGDKDLHIELPRNVTPWLATVAQKAAGAREDCPPVTVSRGEIVTDDHVPFLVAGYPAIDLIDFEYGSAPGRNDYWHTAQDTMEHVSAESLHKTGSLVLAILSRLEQKLDPREP